ncbi:hypothetical protein F750_3226 [Streptomyces sp. PAMC 26508]|nr:hypothetical protein F750_3226 [Streptomyces sp. PAMC 26508]
MEGGGRRLCRSRGSHRTLDPGTDEHTMCTAPGGVAPTGGLTG